MTLYRTKKMTKKINFNGEFGWELLKAVPYAYSLHTRGLLLKTISCRDTRCLYYFSPDHDEMHQKRMGGSGSNWKDSLPFDSIHRSSPPDKANWCPPPYRQHFEGRIVQDQPAIVISNKYNTEWERPPINFISRKSLIEIIVVLKDRYKVYYNRPTSIVGDNSPILNLGEKDEVREAGATLVEEEYQNYKSQMTFNEFQMCLMAGCDKFISVQGGTSILSSYFGGENLILSKAGAELKCKSYSWYPLLSGCNVRVFREDVKLVEAAAVY